MDAGAGCWSTTGARLIAVRRVARGGLFNYRTCNERSTGQEDLLPVHSDSPWEVLTGNLCALVKQGDRAWCFVKARHNRGGARSCWRSA